MFQLHSRLAADCFDLGRMQLCRLLLMNDARYPWCILVPEREGIREIHHLEPADQIRLMEESVVLARAMEQWLRPDKLNVAALGNVVPQLHVHHVARFRNDAAWPAPVWGLGPVQPYSAEQARARTEELRLHLGEVLRF